MYEATNWINGVTPINEGNLNKIEQGIAEAHEALADHEVKIDQFANEQIPEEYVKKAVDDYVKDNSGGFVTQESLTEYEEQLTGQVEDTIGQLSSEIVDLESNVSEVMVEKEIGTFENGSINGENGTLLTDNKRARTGFIPCKKGDVIEVFGDYLIFCGYYTNEDITSFVGISDVWVKEIAIPQDSYVIICAKNSTNTAISDYSDVKNNIKVFPNNTINQVAKTTRRIIEVVRGGIDGTNGSLSGSTNRARTNFVPCKKGDVVVFGDGYNGYCGYYANNDSTSFIGISDTWVKSVIVPQDCYVVCCAKNDMNTDISDYASVDIKIYANSIILDVIKNIPQNEENFSVLLPEKIYCLTGEMFTLNFENIVYPYSRFDSKKYYVKLSVIRNGSVLAMTEENRFVVLPNLMLYTPNTEQTIVLTVSVCDTKTNRVLTSKDIEIVAKISANKTINTLFIGDSFLDSYGVSRYIADRLDSIGNITMLGTQTFGDLNDKSYVPHSTQRDEAYGGKYYSWFYADNNSPFYSDGKTFDISSYMQSHFNGKTLDCFVMMCGFNNLAWFEPNDIVVSNTIKEIEKIVNSVKAYNSNCKILIQLLPTCSVDNISLNGSPNTPNSLIDLVGLFNKMIIENFGGNDDVVLMPVNANWIADICLLSSEITISKFDTVKKLVQNNVHPNTLGAKYIADTVINTINGI